MDENEKRAARNREESIRNQALYIAGQVTAGYCQGCGTKDSYPTPPNMLEMVYRKALTLLKEAIVIP